MRMRRLEHVARVEAERIQHIILVPKPVGKNHPSRPKRRWYDIKINLKEMGRKLWS